MGRYQPPDLQHVVQEAAKWGETAGGAAHGVVAEVEAVPTAGRGTGKLGCGNVLVNLLEQFLHTDDERGAASANLVVEILEVEALVLVKAHADGTDRLVVNEIRSRKGPSAGRAGFDAVVHGSLLLSLM